MKDVRYALRQFAKAPIFTATAILTLALGIGATTAIFTLVHAVLLNSLPVAKPSELYRVGDQENCCVNSGLQDNWSLFSYDKYKTFRDNTPGFVELAAFQAGHDLIGVRRSGSSQAAQSMRSEFVSGNYFAMFGIGPYAGRVLMPDDDRKGASPVAVISYRAWQQTFAGNPAVVGGNFTFNGQPFTVVGIAPPAFFGDRLTDPAAFWIPIADENFIDGPTSFIDFPQQDWLDIIGRIAPGADPKQISAHMQVELQQWLLSPIAQLQPGERDAVAKQTLRLSPGGAGVQDLRDEFQSSLNLLMWISALVLTIACANVANLMLVRASTRKLQTSIRAALGASSARQIRQVLTESVVLSLLGGVVGVAIAFGATRLIRVSKHIRRDPRFAVSARARVHVCHISSHRSSLRRGSGMDHGECRSRRRVAWRGPFHRKRRRLDAKIAGDCASRAITRAAFRGRIVDAEPSQHAGTKFRI